MKIGTDPNDDDTDGDTYLDGDEVLKDTDPLDALSYPGSSIDMLIFWITFTLVGGVRGIFIIAILVKKREWVIQHLRLPLRRPSG